MLNYLKNDQSDKTPYKILCKHHVQFILYQSYRHKLNHSRYGYLFDRESPYKGRIRNFRIQKKDSTLWLKEKIKRDFSETLFLILTGILPFYKFRVQKPRKRW